MQPWNRIDPMGLNFRDVTSQHNVFSAVQEHFAWLPAFSSFFVAQQAQMVHSFGALLTQSSWVARLSRSQLACFMKSHCLRFIKQRFQAESTASLQLTQLHILHTLPTGLQMHT